MSAKAATFTMVGCFLAGAIGIAIVSQILHRYIPHSVVDCDNDHGDEEEGKADGDHDESEHHHHDHVHSHDDEHRNGHVKTNSTYMTSSHSSYGGTDENHPPHSLARRPSLHTAISSKVSQLVHGHKQVCDVNGQCFGCADPYGNSFLQKRPSGLSLRNDSTKSLIRPGSLRTQTMPNERQPLLHDSANGNNSLAPTISGPAALERHTGPGSSNAHTVQKKPSNHSLTSHASSTSSSSTISSTHSHGRQHHHHVPTNAFLSIGLQTSTAIALHKIPEGFITYATNHANPRLGFSIFLALFIHNITEGFALALPLYLAINSRWKAMFWSALLGGISQPLGAGVVMVLSAVTVGGGYCR
jgi:zinc transporter, ZIP family